MIQKGVLLEALAAESQAGLATAICPLARCRAGRVAELLWLVHYTWRSTMSSVPQ
jgi:hypothetical protein